jgi:formiminotetrahydrofolate cyclodeaminase
VRAAVQGGESLSGFVGSVASSSPTPGGGSVAAHVGALGAALAQMVAGLTAGRKKYVAVDAEMRELGLKAAGLVNTLSALVARDADSFTAVSTAYKLPSEPEEALAKRKVAITQALLGASEVPLETARACGEVAKLAAVCATKGNTNAVSDAGVAALLADAACRSAVYNIRINVSSLDDRSLGAGLIAEANQILAQTRAAVEEATAAVDRAIG